MFNELVDAARTLDELGIIRPRRDPRLDPMPNGEMFIVSVDQRGVPAELETLRTDTGLYKIKEEATAKNTPSFPGFNLHTDPDKLNGKPLRTYDYAQRLRAAFAEATPELTNFVRLLDVIASAEISSKDFYAAVAKLLPPPKEPKKEKKRRSKERDHKSLSIYLDLIPALRDPLHRRVAHSKTSALINQHLLAVGDTGFEIGIDHYTGKEGPVQNLFPSPNVSVLGQVKLYSLNTADIPCLSRYGLNKYFQVTPALVQSVSDTLVYLTNRERKGKTWHEIPGNDAKQGDLLIAYFKNGDTELLAEFPGAEMFGGDFSDVDFAALCEPAIKLLEAKLPATPALSVRLLVLSKISQGEQQVNLCREIQVSDLIQACTKWQTGARIAPEIRLPIYDKEANKPISRTSRVPYPLALSSTINRLWRTDGAKVFTCEFQHAFSASDAFEVFLWRSSLARQKAERALDLLVGRMGRVLAALGRNQVNAYKHGCFSVGEDARKYALKALPLIGILVSRLSSSTQIMDTSITQLGRLLNLMDGLHFEYCRHVRKGQVPPQLIGNSFFSAALMRPLETFVAANTRLRPYLAWAQTARVTPECDVRLAKWHLGQINDCIRLIQPDQLPTRMSTIDKAQFICGYHIQNNNTEKDNHNDDTE
jgi:hypothetical protein